MARCKGSLVSLFFLVISATAFTAAASSALAQASPADSAQTLTIPTGARIEVVLVRPVWARTAAPGGMVYAQTTFPVIVGDRTAIPPGSYVQGTIEKLTRPTRRSKRADLEILLNQIVLANGYVAPFPLSAPAASTASSPTQGAQVSAARPETLTDVAIQVTMDNDLLLDNGAQIEMTLAAPLHLNAQSVAEALPLSQAPAMGSFRSATLCRPIAGDPGTPGTADTVIPGTPGTPDTVVPGGPGMPDTVIPGTPATPDTVIPGMPGSPGSPGSACPAGPMVLSSTPVTGQGAQGPAPASARQTSPNLSPGNR
jgi:hypothetical protein